MQELQAPPGYRLDSTKYWFCFCDETEAHCEICEEILADTDALRIPFEQVGSIRVENEIMSYDLPSTGGAGIYPLVLASVMMIVTSLVYGFIRGRKQERRGVG